MMKFYINAIDEERTQVNKDYLHHKTRNGTKVKHSFVVAMQNLVVI